MFINSYILQIFLLFIFSTHLFSQSIYAPEGLVGISGNSSNSIGIGIKNPSYKFHVYDSLDICMVRFEGKIHNSPGDFYNGYSSHLSFGGSGGIGERNGILTINAGKSPIHIGYMATYLGFSGTLNFNIADTVGQFTGATNRFSGPSWMTSLAISEMPTGYTGGWRLINPFKFGVNGHSTFNGNVSIGTDCLPADELYKLAVKGKIIAEGMKVKLQGDECWADHVFQKGYNLTSLYDVEKFIQKNKHLPEIPSEKELKADGLQVEEMLKLQMQKIEELTLYIIEMKKENDTMKEEIKKLKRKN